MACVLWNKARGLILWSCVANLLPATAASGIYVDFAASIPSGTVYAGIPVELIATLKVTSQDGMTRDTLLQQRGFNPRVTWRAQQGSFQRSVTSAVLGDSTLPPNGLVFVSRSTYLPPMLPGEYTISVSPEADPSKGLDLKVVVADLFLRIHPSAVTLAPTQQQSFAATLDGLPDATLLWSTTGGSISPQGLYQAPLGTGVQTVSVRHVPSGKRASALVTIANTFGIQPASLELAPGQSVRFSCPEDQGQVTWSVQELGGGTIETDGTYIAPRVPGTYTIQAIQAAAPSRRATATVRVAPLSITITPATTTLGAGQWIQFKADVSQGTCLWSATEGEISEDGMYHAPLAFGTCQVTATSALDPEVRATASVSVNAMELIQVVPGDLTLHVGQTQQFTVPGLAGEATPAWLVQPVEAGTITESGLFTAGTTPGACSVMAFLEDRVSVASVKLIDTRVLPDPAQVRPGGSLQFTAQGLPKDAPIEWFLTPASSGIISSDGLFTAGNRSGSGKVTATAGGVEASASFRILAARIAPEEALVAPGETVRFTSEVFDAPGQVVTWRLLGDQPGAFLGQDGVYKAPTRQGIYQIAASVPTGLEAQAKVIVGPPNGLMLVPEVSVEQDGMYTVWIRLKASNGRTVEGSFTGDLQRGLAYPEIAFPARQMLLPLGVDGPYAIERIWVTGARDDETILFDVRENLGVTEAFSIEESTKQWIRIGEITEVRGQGRDASGPLDSLLVTIPVEVATAGEYRVMATLTTEDGTAIDTHSGTQTLARGTHPIVLAFDGRKIHARGSPGPLSIARFTVEGPVVRSRDFPGGIKGYDFRLFKP